MEGRKWLSWFLAAMLAAALLAGCGRGGRNGRIALDYNAINQMLQEDGQGVCVARSQTLDAAVEDAAALLAGYDWREADAAVAEAEILRQTGAAPLICEIYDQAYWPNKPFGSRSRHEQTAASFAQRLYQEGRGGAYTASMACFTSRDGRGLILCVMAAEK